MKSADAAWIVDAHVLRRYDRLGPRYTSYPTAPHFHEGFDHAAMVAAIERVQQRAPTTPLSLYIHVPFCSHPCFYCGCHRVITRDRRKGGAYVQRILREARTMAATILPERPVVQIHLGGGTPNFLSSETIHHLIQGLQSDFYFAPLSQRDFSIELDPRTMDEDAIAALRTIGFNRVSFGVQDFDPAVQSAINRHQDVAQTLRLIRACRDNAIASVNIDLIYGLPRQRQEGFGRTLDTIVAARPDRIAVYGYAHLPQRFRGQRQISEDALPDGQTRLALLGLAVRTLTDAGYLYIGMDHFALPNDPLALAQRQGALHRNFMGYTTHADADLIGFGVSAISHIGDSYWQNARDLGLWEAAIDACGIAVWRGLRLSAEDRLRAEIIQALMCQGRVDCLAVAQRHAIDFLTHFADALARLQPLVDDGFVTVTEQTIAVTARGRPLVRLAAMCFDQYLDHTAERPLPYARTL